MRAAQERRGRGFKRHNGGDTNTPFVNVFDHSAQGEETEVDYGQQEDVNGGEDI